MMKDCNLLEFIKNQSHYLYVMNCASKYECTDDFLLRIRMGEFYDSDIEFGILYLARNSKNDYLIVDGKRRIISFLLLLKSLYNRMTEEKNFELEAKNLDFACLKCLGIPKIQLFGFEKTIFNKIINDEPLNYNEKQTELYKIYEIIRQNIENEKINLQTLYSLIKRVNVKIEIVDVEQSRDVSYYLNKDIRDLDQIMLIKSFLAEVKKEGLIDALLELFNNREEVLTSFFKCYLSSKFGNKNIAENDLYFYFKKYFNMVKSYQDDNNFKLTITNTAKIFKKMYNADFYDADLRNIFINIISNKGRDTFSYLLELCEDYENKLLSKKILISVCEIINTYLIEKNTTGSYRDLDFSQMVEELNKVICEQQ